MPMACLKKERTITMRIKDVVINNMAGAIVKIVIKTNICNIIETWAGPEGDPKFKVRPGKSCANPETGHINGISTVIKSNKFNLSIFIFLSQNVPGGYLRN